jgi:hypothetical protein
MDEVDEFLAHYGVLGMKWGKRNGNVEGVSRRTSRDAAKDAKEHAQAKMYYGEGAGVRRRLIKNTVESKSKRDPNYKKAFDHHLANQDLSKAADKARSKRKRTDAANTTKKTVKGIGHIMNGNAQYASAAAALLVGGAMYAHKAGIDKLIMDKGKEFVNSPKFKEKTEHYKQQSGGIFDQIRDYDG